MNISPTLAQSASYAAATAPEKKDVDPANPNIAASDASHDGSEKQAQTERPVTASQKAQSELQLTQQELKLVDQLKARDREVKTHEQAHIAASSGHASSPTYQYQKGPDGRMYAESGEVSIDTGAIKGDPQATIDKMQAVIKAANAPAQPSAQDKKVAAQAQVMLNDATLELAELQQEQKQAEQAMSAAASNLSDSSAAESSAEGQSDKPAKAMSHESNPQQNNNAAAQTIEQQREQNAQSRDALERKFVDSGAFAKAFPQGSLINSLL